MASTIAALNPKLPPTHAGQLLRDFVDAFDNVQEQLRKGATKAVVPLTKISLLGTEGVAILKKHLEDATDARFIFSVDASANSVTLMPAGPMPPKTSITALAAGKASKTAGSKVPRPPNAFIIYRKDWHPRVVAENPGLHNNAISVIIGDKWKNESEAVRDAYKRKAEEAKEQHAIANPGYQYQPRKPSEKKKRMTKNKLAKLAAQAQENGNISGDITQQPLPDNFDPFTMLDHHLGNCAATQPMDVTSYANTAASHSTGLRPTTEPGVLAFESGVEDFSSMFEELAAFNASHTGPANALQETGAITAQSTINGQWIENTVQHELPGVGFYNEMYNQIEFAAEMAMEPTTAAIGEGQNRQAVTSTTPQTFVLANPLAEVARTDRLEDDFHTFVDCTAYEGATTNTVGPADTQVTYNLPCRDATEDAGVASVMDHFNQNYDLDLEALVNT